jgi:hypothetical protein
MFRRLFAVVAGLSCLLLVTLVLTRVLLHPISIHRETFHLDLWGDFTISTGQYYKDPEWEGQHSVSWHPLIDRMEFTTWEDLESKTPRWKLFVPYYLAWLATIVLPLAWLAIFVFQFSRFLRRVHAGMCPSCGFDLRATPERCPECGQTPPERSASRNSASYHR